MKTYKKTYLPEFIVYNGNLLHCNGAISGTMNASGTNPKAIIKELKKQGRKGVLVQVLSSRLKGKTDLHGQPYKPTKWIFSN